MRKAEGPRHGLRTQRGALSLTLPRPPPLPQAPPAAPDAGACTAPGQQRPAARACVAAPEPAASAPDASWPGPRPGYAWADSRGTELLRGPPPPVPPQPAPPAPLPPAAAALAALPAGERSMRIWKRVSPGMLPGSSLTPTSTNAATYAPYPPEQLPRPDMTHHLRKTDFSEYVEARERQHVALKAKS